MVEQAVFAQLFTMVRGHDHHRPIEYATPSQVIEQLAQPLVQIGKTTIIAVSNQVAIMRGQHRLVDRGPAFDQEEIIVQSSGPHAEANPAPSGGK